MMGGPRAAAGGLVFTGEGNGWFKAYDAKTGTVLWKFYCGAGVNAAPSVYELDGEQFIAVAAGGNFQISYPLGNSVFIFGDRKSTRLNSSHLVISYAVFCLKKKNNAGFQTPQAY